MDSILDDEDFTFSEHFVFRSVLGKGGFGLVVEAVSRETLESMAVKVIEVSKIGSMEEDKIKGEAIMLNELDHEHIVKFKKCYVSQNKLYLATEKLNGGSLLDLVVTCRKAGRMLNEIEASKIIKEILEAVAYLHERGIAHRDLKPDNIMFQRKNDINSLQLVDFGLSGHSSSLTEKCGTWIYMAPEVYANPAYSKHVDIWSIGIIMYILLTGLHPLYVKGDSKKTYGERIQKPHWTFPNTVSPLAQSLFQKLVQTNPLERYTANEALQHPWITRKPGLVPLSFVENDLFGKARERLVSNFFILFFLANTKSEEINETYNEKIKEISSIVEKWSEEYNNSGDKEFKTDNEIYEKMNEKLPDSLLAQTESNEEGSLREMTRISLFTSTTDSCETSPNWEYSESPPLRARRMGGFSSPVATFQPHSQRRTILQGFRQTQKPRGESRDKIHIKKSITRSPIQNSQITPSKLRLEYGYKSFDNRKRQNVSFKIPFVSRDSSIDYPYITRERGAPSRLPPLHSSKATIRSLNIVSVKNTSFCRKR